MCVNNVNVGRVRPNYLKKIIETKRIWMLEEFIVNYIIKTDLG